MALKDHPDIKSISSGFEVRADGSHEYVVTVFTDLVLDVTQAGHNQEKVDSLLNAAFDHIKRFQGQVDRISVRSAP
jgi:hypothetical protein